MAEEFPDVHAVGEGCKKVTPSDLDGVTPIDLFSFTSQTPPAPLVKGGAIIREDGSNSNSIGITGLGRRERFLAVLRQHRKAVVGAGVGLSLLLTGIPSVYFLKPDWLSPVLVTMGWQNPVQKTVKILVARFDGPEAQYYRVTEKILNEIRGKTADYKDVQIVPLGRAITEEEGKDVARRVGKEKQADIVIWGWYGKTKDKVPLSVHFELLTKPNELPELSAEVQGKVRSLSVAKLESFEMQVDLAQELTYLSLVTLGMSRYSANDWDSAIDRLTAALKSVKVIPKALDASAIYFSRANAYYYKGENDPAITDLNQALKLNANYAEAYNSRGIAYGVKGEYDRAIADFNQALKLNPKYAEAYKNRGIAYSDKGENDRAITDFNQALKLNPKYVEAYNSRGIAYRDKGEYDQAIADFNQALKLNPKDVYAYNNRGTAYVKKGENDRAIADYNQALKLDPNYAAAYNNRGIVYSHQGENDRAITDFNQALKLNPNLAKVYSNRGVVYARNGEYDRAITDFNQALKLDPNYAAAYNNRGVAYGKKGEYDRESADYNQALKLNPKYADAYNNRGVAYRDKGDNDHAIADFNQAIKINPKYANAYAGRGIAYAKKGDYARAFADYNQALKLDPNEAEAYYNRGLAYRAKGDKQKAIADFQACLQFAQTPQYKQDALQQLAELGVK